METMTVFEKSIYNIENLGNVIALRRLTQELSDKRREIEFLQLHLSVQEMYIEKLKKQTEDYAAAANYYRDWIVNNKPKA